MTYYRKCPKCGYTEPIAWRGSRFIPDWEICDGYEFQNAYQDSPVTKWFNTNTLGRRYGIIDGDFYYWRQKGKSSHLLHRVPLVVYRANGNRVQPDAAYIEKTVPL
jgi:hypothetical protein